MPFYVGKNNESAIHVEPRKYDQPQAKHYCHDFMVMIMIMTTYEQSCSLINSRKQIRLTLAQGAGVKELHQAGPTTLVFQIQLIFAAYKMR